MAVLLIPLMYDDNIAILLVNCNVRHIAFFIARRNDSAVSVRLSICPSQVGVLSKTAKDRIMKTTPYDRLELLADARDLGVIRMASPSTELCL